MSESGKLSFFSRYSEFLLGLSIFIFALFYFILTKDLPQRMASRSTFVDAKFLPYILSFVMMILSSFQMYYGILKSKKISECEKSKSSDDYISVIKISLLIIIYVSILKSVGFLVSSFLCLFFSFIILEPESEDYKNKKNKYYIYAFIALVSSSLIYFLFRYGLDLMLPEGILSYFLR